MIQDIKQFKLNLQDQIQRVIDWNILAGNVGEDKIPVYNHLCDEEVGEWSDAVWMCHPIKDVLKESCDVLVVHSYYGYLAGEDTTAGYEPLWLLSRLGVDVHGALKAVVDSNWSKFSSVSDTTLYSIEGHCRALESKRYPSVSYTVNGKGFVIWRDVATGKLLKGPEYKEPDLRPFLPEQARYV